MNRQRAACLVSLAAFLGLVGASLYVGHALTRSTNHPVALTQAASFTRVEFVGDSGRVTRAFYCPAPGRRAFILAHGNSSDGASMLPRARWLVSQGYSVLVPDLQAHGESPGERKSFGWREAGNIASAHRYLETQLGKDWIGGIGSSLGGASMLKAAAGGIRFDALVLESVYADIRIAVRNRLELRMGGAGRFFEPLLTGQLPLWCGITRNQLAPSAWASKVRCDVLVLVGGADRLAKPWESEAIFASLPSRRKGIVVMEGAGHIDLFAYDPGGYIQALQAFLQQTHSPVIGLTAPMESGL